MKISTRPAIPSGVSGPTRVGRPTRALIQRLNPGDVAVIDHRDLDRPTAEAMIAAGVVAVVNAQPMISGRYANQGPLALAAAGVALIDQIGESSYARLADNPGEVTVEEGQVLRGGDVVAHGRGLTVESIGREMAAAESGLAAHVDTFTRNSAQLISRDLTLLLEGDGLPHLSGKFHQRPAVVVGHAHPAEVTHLRSFVRQEKPVVIAVDLAADRLRAHRITADVVVISQFDRLPNTKVLKAAHEVIVVSTPDTPASAVDAIARTGVHAHFISTHATGDDVAVLVARSLNSTVVVGAGLPSTLADFLDQQRPGLAGSFLARLALGGRYVDAESIPLLYTGRVRPWHMVSVGIVAVAGVGAAVAATPVGQGWIDTIGTWL